MKPITLELQESVDGGKGHTSEFGTIKFDLGDFASAGLVSEQKLAVSVMPSVAKKGTGTPILRLTVTCGPYSRRRPCPTL